jgi:hypothetical protein
MDFTPRGWLNPDFKPEFSTPSLIRAFSRWCFGGVSGLQRIRWNISSPQG